MRSRRDFLRLSALAAAVFTLDKKRAAVMIPPAGGNQVKPVVLSTWRFGVAANEGAWQVLQQGGRSLDAVEAGVKITEADPKERSVGLGGRPDRDGVVSLDACIMDELSNIGAVGFLQGIVHPVSVARAVMEKTPHAMLVGEGALRFALSQGFKKTNLLTPESETEWKEWLKRSEYTPEVNVENHDTIGMIALDSHGNLSGACTTSGLAYKMHGRIGDSPIIGAGLFVDNEVGAATATGHGEEVIRIAGCHTVVELMRGGHSPQQACQLAVDRIVTSAKKRNKPLKDLQIGFLALNRNGEHGAFSLQKGFQFAHYSPSVKNLLTDAKHFM